MRPRKGYVQRLEEGVWAVALMCLALGLFVGLLIARLIGWGDGPWSR